MSARTWRLGAWASAGLFAWALVPVALLIGHTILHGGVLVGSNGPGAGGDQLFYMSEIRQSGTHLLIGDQYAIGLGHDVFLDPFYLLGGVLWLIGLPLQAAFWTLDLLAVLAVAAGTVALAARAFTSSRQRAATLALALLYFSPITAALLWLGHFGPLSRIGVQDPAWEIMPLYNLWGYPHSGVVIGALVLAVLGCVKIAEGDRSWRTVIISAAAACLAAWIHPWQGATFVLIGIALIATVRSKAVSIRVAVPMAGAGAPMVYERLLEHFDAAWKTDAAQNAVGHPYTWALVLAVVPILIPALFGIKALSRGPLRTAVIVWPCASLIVYFATAQFPYHSLEGISLPLAVLAVAGISRWATAPARMRWASAGAVCAVAAAIAGLAYELKLFHAAERSTIAPYVMPADDAAALSYLNTLRTPGGVLAREYIGVTVPAFTGRDTWVGQWTWTPSFNQRVTQADNLMDGRMTAAQARQFVASTGATFVLRDCGAGPAVTRLLGPLITALRSFGCATVYRLRTA